MPSFEMNKLQAVTAPRALSDTDRAGTLPITAPSTAKPAAAAPANGVSIEVGPAVDPTTPPIDNERVQEIRAALKNDSYPLVPTEIADAIIAAQLSFEIDK